ncbi:alpha/beta fold hydrolase [Mesorhizobium sp. B292B1B]|uniref:alpha/beta fold hydrolase n=1 Tax=unclassified Mesorhizobium TaxID=325217 RepID=UPI00112659F8|nr:MULTISPECIES: alpha/beta hydrolase [unclassified Mesorhizobium]MCA0011390.1 alpha/beta fold hydrolase [Mesorhizobium sp. B294B1A1]MCA0037038.1 alpha/beta fold hydrolase [Mesorhizobium sp. B292B1B]TPM47017.1 alpha/beta hydrolase [Mesorhizobium sp. B2-3-2]
MTKTGRPDIISEAFGDPADPALLLIMGAMASMLWWPEALCRKLAGAGLFVLRYDNRDTGRSTKYPPGEPPYTFDDIADDAIGVLDSHGLAKAHIAGMSGGMIAQLVALKHPSRVASLTVISSSPLGVDTSNLPQTSDAYIEHSAEGAHIDWSDRRQVIDFMIKDTRAIASTAHPFDEGRMRAFIERDYDRSGGLLSATNHFLLKGDSDRWRGRLHEMKAPLLVIHGTADPLFPVEHGEALARAVAGAKLLRVEGGGHELHLEDWDVIVAGIVAHIRPIGTQSAVLTPQVWAIVK